LAVGRTNLNNMKEIDIYEFNHCADNYCQFCFISSLC